MTITFPNTVGTIEVYMDCLRAICGETEGKSMLDIGCCTAPNTPKLGFYEKCYIDMIDRKLDHKDEQQFFIKMNALDIFPGWTKKIYDVVICSDCIEHLLKYKGHELIRKMEVISLKQILFTPTTDLFGMVKDDDHNPEAHRSLWTTEDLPGFASVIFPDYHKSWSGGAAFYWLCGDIEQDFKRVKNILMEKVWAKN